MKSAMVLCLSLVATAAATGLLRKREPVEPKDSFGVSKLEPPCAGIACGESACPAPFELKMDATCCGYCWAPDQVVSVDRHKVVAYNATGFAVDQCDSAPSTCKGPGPTVRCFKPSCQEGEKVHCAAAACCAGCVKA
mmetsp:Transcript_118472/g.215483  ORF Transcript_118472/g.215483 Transcript_118472/m.215483 type:complete len:137 (+) Transcript_118472:105-515(+)